MFFYLLTMIITFISLSTYCSYHLYYSFFNNLCNNYIFISLSTISMICFLFSLPLLSYLPTFFQKTLEICLYFFMVFLLYSALLYFILDIIGFFIHINPLKKGIIALTLTFFVLLSGYINTRFIRENSYTILSNKVKKDTNIVLISDLHIGALDMTIKKINRMVNQINKLDPDIILIAGDIVDNAGKNIEELGFLPILSKLHAKEGVFATLGNHEYYAGSVNNVIHSLEKLKNIKLLNNTEYQNNNLNINIVGLSDKGLEKERKLDITYFKLDKNIFNLVIEHNPINFEQNIKEFPIDLQVSGHTHAGQVFLGYIIEAFMYKKPWGFLNINNSNLITSCGVGTWGPPIRDISYPEIVNIYIKKSS